MILIRIIFAKTLMNYLKLRDFFCKHWPFWGGALLIAVFFYPVWAGNLLPIAADTIVGLYHPFRDIVWDGFSNGVPFKNFLITDPVRQLFPWRFLAIDLMKAGHFPFWNPYQFAGYPLAANLQSAVFYPFNLFFFIFNFNLVWSLLILLQPLLAFIFTYLFLKNLKLTKLSAAIGSLSFSFSSFFIAWLEWGTVLHVALWLPLLLFLIDKLSKDKKSFIWVILITICLSCSFFAGHLQTFFYLFLLTFAYFVFRVVGNKKVFLKKTTLFFGSLVAFVIITLPQWLATLGLISLSARSLDQLDWQKEGWFLPIKHLTTLFAPDFFGNPTTLNYWGDWNYGELTIFVGTIPLFLALLAVVSKKGKEIIFFTLTALVALSFALPTPWAKLPFVFNLPFISSAQPSRLIFLVVFCLSVLAAFGVEKLLENKKRFYLLPLILSVVAGSWAAAWLLNLDFVTRRNLILPTGLALAFVAILLAGVLTERLFKKQNLKFKNLLYLGLFLLIAFDLFRFGRKFTPFVNRQWLFPSTKAISFLQAQEKPFRIMSVDSRILPPNFATFYKLEDVAGYDPLYLKAYGQLVAAWARNEPNIEPPFGFNRIITPTNFESRLADLLNVEFILSLSQLDSEKLTLVFEEGQTKIYQNNNAFDRAFVVFNFETADTDTQAINFLFDEKNNLKQTAVVQNEPGLSQQSLACDTKGSFLVEFTDHQPGAVNLKVANNCPGLLILTDSFYPGWEVFVNDKQEKIYRTNYNFRGVFLPAGEHRIKFVI